MMSHDATYLTRGGHNYILLENTPCVSIIFLTAPTVYWAFFSE